jgi:hypothetical protein
MQGKPLVAPEAGATATALAIAVAAEKAGQPRATAPEGAPIAESVAAAPPVEGAASPTANSYVVKGDVLESSGAAGAAGESTGSPLDDDKPDFAMLLVGVVVLAGVAVFMKGRM